MLLVVWKQTWLFLEWMRTQDVWVENKASMIFKVLFFFKLRILTTVNEKYAKRLDNVDILRMVKKESTIIKHLSS